MKSVAKLRISKEKDLLMSLSLSVSQATRSHYRTIKCVVMVTHALFNSEYDSCCYNNGIFILLSILILTQYR